MAQVLIWEVTNEAEGWHGTGAQQRAPTAGGVGAGFLIPRRLLPADGLPRSAWTLTFFGLWVALFGKRDAKGEELNAE